MKFDITDTLYFQSKVLRVALIRLYKEIDREIFTPILELLIKNNERN